MPISSTTVNSSGRTRDIHIMKGVDPSGIRKPVTLEFGSTSSFSSGVQKLVQRYMISLLTILGSQKDYPAFGTKLISTLNNASLSFNTLDAQNVFGLANFEVISAFRNYQANTSDLPSDEQISTAYLTNMSVSTGQVSFQVTLVTMAGNTVQFIIPLPES